MTWAALPSGAPWALPCSAWSSASWCAALCSTMKRKAVVCQLPPDLPLAYCNTFALARRSVWCWCGCCPCRAPSGLIRLDCSSSTSSWASSASSSNSERGWCLAIHAVNLCIKPRVQALRVYVYLVLTRCSRRMGCSNLLHQQREILLRWFCPSSMRVLHACTGQEVLNAVLPITHIVRDSCCLDNMMVYSVTRAVGEADQSHVPQQQDLRAKYKA